MADSQASEAQENILGGGSTKLIPSDIKKEWSWVRPGLEYIQNADPDPLQIPEDVYAACVNGSGHLYIDENREFFAILSTIEQPYKGKELVLWYTWNKNRHGHRLSDNYVPLMEDLAREIGCDKLMFETTVPEVAKYAENHGWFIDTIVVKKVVNG